MTFTVVRSEDENDFFAPWQVLLDGEVFLSQIEFESEAESICDCLRLAPPVSPHPEKIVILNAKRTPRFVPKKIEGWKLLETRKLLNEQPK